MDPDPGGPNTCGSGSVTLRCANVVYTVGTQPEKTFTAEHLWKKPLMPKLLSQKKNNCCVMKPLTRDTEITHDPLLSFSVAQGIF
jgi:hypothetical protein